MPNHNGPRIMVGGHGSPVGVVAPPEVMPMPTLLTPDSPTQPISPEMHHRTAHTRQQNPMTGHSTTTPMTTKPHE
jgi:hypothetical protein